MTMGKFQDKHLGKLDVQQRQQLTLARQRVNQSIDIVMLLAERAGLNVDRKSIILPSGRNVLQTRVDFLQEAADAIEGSKVGHTRSKRFSRLRSRFRGIRTRISDRLKKRQMWRNSKNSKKTDGPDNTSKPDGPEKSKPDDDKPEEPGKKKKGRLSSAVKTAVKTGVAVGAVAAVENSLAPDIGLPDFPDLPGVDTLDLLQFADLPAAGDDEDYQDEDYQDEDYQDEDYQDEDYQDEDSQKGDYQEEDYEDGNDLQQTLDMFTISTVSVSKETKFLKHTPNCYPPPTGKLSGGDGAVCGSSPTSPGEFHCVIGQPEHRHLCCPHRGSQ